MAWTAPAMATGIFLASVGAIVLLGGAIALVVEAWAPAGDGLAGVIAAPSADPASQVEREEVLALGAVVTAFGAAKLLAGGLIYAVAQGVHKMRHAHDATT